MGIHSADGLGDEGFGDARSKPCLEGLWGSRGAVPGSTSSPTCIHGANPIFFPPLREGHFANRSPSPLQLPAQLPDPLLLLQDVLQRPSPPVPAYLALLGELGKVLVAFPSHGMGSHHTLIARWLRMEAFRSLLQLATAAITLGFPLFHLPLLLSHLLGFIPSSVLSSSSSKGHVGTPKPPAAGQGSRAGVCTGSRSAGTETHGARSQRDRGVGWGRCHGLNPALQDTPVP